MQVVPITEIELYEAAKCSCFGLAIGYHTVKAVITVDTRSCEAVGASVVVAMVQSNGYKAISAKIFIRKQKPLKQPELLKHLTLPFHTISFL